MLGNSHPIFSGGSYQKIVAICAMFMSITIARCGANLLRPFGSMRSDERARRQAAIELIAGMVWSRSIIGIVVPNLVNGYAEVRVVQVVVFFGGISILVATLAENTQVVRFSRRQGQPLRVG